MRAIAKAMGFAPEAWFEDGLGDRRPIRLAKESRSIAGRIEHLFDAVRNPKTGEPYTNAEVARMTLGDLSKEDVEGIRSGAIANPTVGQVAALANVFGVEPSYLLDRGESVFNGELVEALQDEAVREAALEISRLPERSGGRMRTCDLRIMSPTKQVAAPVSLDLSHRRRSTHSTPPVPAAHRHDLPEYYLPFRCPYPACRQLRKAPLGLRAHEEASELLGRHSRRPRSAERVEDELPFRGRSKHGPAK
jgi:transcriptional regulator with XRE-family HTH domain